MTACPAALKGARAAQLKFYRYYIAVQQCFKKLDSETRKADADQVRGIKAVRQTQRRLDAQVLRVTEARKHITTWMPGSPMRYCTQCCQYVKNPSGRCQPTADTVRRAAHDAEGKGHLLHMARMGGRKAAHPRVLLKVWQVLEQWGFGSEAGMQPRKAAHHPFGAPQSGAAPYHQRAPV